MHHQGVTMPGRSSRSAASTSSSCRRAARRLPRPDREGHAVPDTRRARSRSSRRCSAKITDWTQTQYGYEIPAIPKWIEPWESLNSPKTEGIPVPSDLAASAPSHPLDLQQHRLAARDLRAGGDDQRLGRRAGSASRRAIRSRCSTIAGECVVPAYVTERCMPGVAVLHEGAWMDLDEKGVDRAGNPDFLTLDEPSPGRRLRLQHGARATSGRRSCSTGPAGIGSPPPAATYSAAISERSRERQHHGRHPRPPSTRPRSRKPSQRKKARGLHPGRCPSSSSASSTTTSIASAAAPARSPARTRTAWRPARASAASCTSRAAPIRTCSPTR